ncbi:MAG: Lipoprotein-releasing system ATP-binding protein LolD [bacterium]|nr:Lipoprotein-releasing system ATP-binding protein LolD [bacterium]
MSAKPPILITRNLVKHYPTASGALEVLKGIDVAIYAGEIIAIVGPSGVGKSTFLNILGALDRPTAGEVEIDGTLISQLDDSGLAQFRNRTIGFVFQFHHLLPEFSALENVMMPALIARRNGHEVVARAKQLLADVGLAQRLSHRPGELSGGEQQRVAVARALMNAPHLVLADEPSGNLDLRASESLHQLLWNLSRRDGRTFIIVTHNLELAKKADRVIELFDGRIKKIHQITGR